MKFETEDYIEVKGGGYFSGSPHTGDLFTVALKSELYTLGIIEKTKQDEYKITIKPKENRK